MVTIFIKEARSINIRRLQISDEDTNHANTIKELTEEKINKWNIYHDEEGYYWKCRS